ncbi:24141_t:CDS:2, partial [Gigaspora rosea]
MRYSISYQQFDSLKNKLLAKFSDSASYLNRALFNEKEYWAYCYVSKYFTAGMQSTQRAEGQNAIIKNSVNSSTSLINLVKHIDEQINRASTHIQYKNCAHSVTGSTFTHASFEFSPDVDKWITIYLIPASLSMQRQEISQAMWYIPHFIENFQDLGLHFDSTRSFNSIEQSNSIDQYEQFDFTEPIEQSDSANISNTFIEDSVDMPAILIKELVPSTKVESIHSTKASIIIEQTFSNLSFRLPNISFSDVHTKINHRKAYVTANSLSKKAIQTGIDAGPNAIKELESFMSSFISKYAPKSNKKMNRKRFERQLNDEDETTSNSSSSDKENFIDIENPIVHSKRGAPRKKQLKGSNKLVNKHISGHNKTGCETWHKQQDLDDRLM